jgi:hypothetical protein
VVERGEVGDARLALILDRGQKPSLRERDRHADALVGQSVEPGHHGEQVCAKRRGHGAMIT